MNDERILTISELIEILQKIMAECGDLLVYHNDDTREFELTEEMVRVYPEHRIHSERLVIG